MVLRMNSSLSGLGHRDGDFETSVQGLGQHGDATAQLTHAIHLQVFEICGQVQRMDRICLRNAWKYALIPYGLTAQVINNRLYP